MKKLLAMLLMLMLLVCGTVGADVYKRQVLTEM